MAHWDYSHVILPGMKFRDNMDTADSYDSIYWQLFCLQLGGGVVHEMNHLREIHYVKGVVFYVVSPPGVGVTKPISSFPLFSDFFSALSKHTLDIEYHVNIWQVSPQLSCSDTCQIWMWFKESKRYFWKKILLKEKLTNRALVTPTPGQCYDQVPIFVGVWPFV